MNRSIRLRILTAITIALVVGVVWFLLTGPQPVSERPTASNYYHGVFQNRSDPRKWGDEKGNPAPPPADAIPYDPDNPNRDFSRENIGPGMLAAKPAARASSPAAGKSN